jgi:hypothetical protein
VDFDYQRSLLSLCDASHDACKRDWSSDAFAITVIDCDSFELRTASPDVRYAALSYVWGSNQSQDTAETSTGRLLNPPLLIKDAMLATKSLGLNYLWVDRYCIDGSDPAVKHEQIKRMDRTYGNSEITLIALVDDPSYGLPGVIFRRTINQPSLSIDGRDVISSMGSPARSIKNSRWYKRAWTFQEAVLSRRRLYFTPEQAYFECCATQHCETVSFTQSEDILSGMRGPWVGSVTHLDPDLSLGHLRELLKTYSLRDMTYQSDAINAFQGILQRYSRAPVPVKHYFGVPFTTGQHPGLSDMREMERSVDDISNSFIAALTWSAENATRRPGFPSWSWAGWRGENFLPMVHDDNDSQAAATVRIAAMVHEQDGKQAAAIWDNHASATEIRIERRNGKVQSFQSFCEEGGLYLPMSEQSHFLWIGRPAAQAKFLSHPTLNPKYDGQVILIAIALTWGNSNGNEQCYQSIGRELPKAEELKLYSDFMVLQLGESSSAHFVLVVGSRDGKKERVGFLKLYKRAFWIGGDFKARVGIPEHMPFKSIDNVAWKKQIVRLG